MRKWTRGGNLKARTRPHRFLRTYVEEYCTQNYEVSSKDAQDVNIVFKHMLLQNSTEEKPGKYKHQGHLCNLKGEPRKVP